MCMMHMHHECIYIYIYVLIQKHKHKHTHTPINTHEHTHTHTYSHTSRNSQHCRSERSFPPHFTHRGLHLVVPIPAGTQAHTPLFFIFCCCMCHKGRILVTWSFQPSLDLSNRLCIFEMPMKPPIGLYHTQILILY